MASPLDKMLAGTGLRALMTPAEWIAFVQRQWPAYLAANLRIAAGLTVSFELGRDFQNVLTNADWLETMRERDAARSEVMRDYFSPGCNRPAPGWREACLSG